MWGGLCGSGVCGEAHPQLFGSGDDGHFMLGLVDRKMQHQVLALRDLAMVVRGAAPRGALPSSSIAAIVVFSVPRLRCQTAADMFRLVLGVGAEVNVSANRQTLVIRNRINGCLNLHTNAAT